MTFPLALLGGLLAAALCVAGLVVALAYPNLPALDTLTDYQPKVPLRVYTAEGELIGEFGEERRVLVDIKEVPPALTNAIIAAEDERFYQHAGIDYLGVARAAYANMLTGGRRQGASTITMQVARNFFLSSEKTLTRKLYEVLL
ncbi:MAG: transglycosylase domain-containing protein, partial [Burkholderiales bacterium]